MLEGLRVVEFSRLIAAPFCGLTLADLGADVVKVESPAGDDTRTFPPVAPGGESAYFHALNRGKRGVVVDLDDADGLQTARRLVERADVVVENLGAAASRLGFGYEEASGANERLVWCSITGLGAGRGGRALDPTLQASMGLMALTGEPEGPPLRVPVPLIDLMTGMYASQSVLTALWHAERSGKGAFLDCALVDSAATLTSLTALLALCGAEAPRRLGSESLPCRPQRRVRGLGRGARAGGRPQRAPVGGALRRARPPGVARRSPFAPATGRERPTAAWSTSAFARSSPRGRARTGSSGSRAPGACASGCARSRRPGPTRCSPSVAWSGARRMAPPSPWSRLPGPPTSTRWRPHPGWGSTPRRSCGSLRLSRRRR